MSNRILNVSPKLLAVLAGVVGGIELLSSIPPYFGFGFVLELLYSLPFLLFFFALFSAGGRTGDRLVTAAMLLMVAIKIGRGVLYGLEFGVVISIAAFLIFAIFAYFHPNGPKAAVIGSGAVLVLLNALPSANWFLYRMSQRFDFGYEFVQSLQWYGSDMVLIWLFFLWLLSVTPAEALSVWDSASADALAPENIPAILAALESDYRAGRIPETEYRAKRAEILSRL